MSEIRAELGSQSWALYTQVSGAAWLTENRAEMCLLPEVGQRLAFVGDLEPVRVVWVNLEDRQIGVKSW